MMPTLRAGELDDRHAQLVDRHRHERDGDLLARGEQHVHLPLGGRSLICRASSISSSVVSPSAETTTTT